MGLREREMPLLATLCWFVLTFEATLGQSLTGTAGEAVSLSCGSNSGCTWSKDGVELVLEVITQYQDWQRTSRLLLKNVKVDDYGEYACFAENQVGNDLAMTQLMVKSSVDILSVVAAITCILGVLLLLAIFVYIRLKRNCCQELPQEKC